MGSQRGSVASPARQEAALRPQSTTDPGRYAWDRWCVYPPERLQTSIQGGA
ncbi:MAG TPA: hypothetical protein VKP65_09675 [Rhodothermales bacterium]|nr:hypothetical protein [Rhodothermales bacterium]